MPTSLAINYWGYFTPFGGYGISNLNWIKYLEKTGVKIYPHGKFIPAENTLEYSVLDDAERKILKREFKKQKIGIIETTPFSFGLINNDVKIGSTMCETDRIAGDWVQQCLKMDYIVVPNEFNKRVFIESGIPEEMVTSIRPGIDTERFPYHHRPIRDVYTFGTVGYMNERKSVFEIIQAFVSEFEPWEPARLYIKSSNKDFGYYSYLTDDRITVDIRHLSVPDVNNLYKSFDCFVFPSKAEGIGMPPREAMSTGLPVIVMNYSGLEEIANENYAYVIEPKELVEGMNPVGEQPGRWATVDVQELMYWMRYAFSHPEDSAEMGRRASSWMRTEHSWPSAANRMKNYLREVEYVSLH